ncbi:MAG: Phosphomannomutase [Candidatus Collierbacteria bacterium GW2011_GWA1_44_12]|uniref:Phosphomannomutase n=1 Tax=Candidatus Collierbacteria bacterium GW2011_GWA1_44_12 TaxID=1618376 RepID=A0A0G1ISD4_9BACT|nr:MAG: Phosphomannomutase [Candidatus Collierbacteria bacterium GW2011_GWA1_44_12]
MTVNPLIFRGYDIRGIVGQDLNEEIVYSLGRAYGTLLAGRRIKVCPVGHDNRLESERFSKAFIKGLNESGIDTYYIGNSLSQIVYFSSYLFFTRGYAMITASHNSKEFNGLKLGIGYSESLSGEGIQNLRRILEKGSFVSGKGKNSNYNVFPEYQKNLLKLFNLKKRWKIVVDACNSTSGQFYPTIFSKTGCQVIKQNCNLDSNFPLGTPDPTDSNVLKRLSERVIKEKADIGFAFDADGDRMAAVDELGRGHWMDIILSIFVRDILETLPGSTIVYNSLCSKTVHETIVKFGGNPIMWKTGHSYIKEKMKEAGALLGGELSGHIFFLDNYFGHDDAAYACLRLLSFLERKNISLAQAATEFQGYIGSPEIKLGVDDNLKFNLVQGPIKQDLINSWPGATINELDGVRIDTPDTMVIIRASQNGPYLTARFESRTESMYNLVKSRVKDILKRRAEINWNEGVNVEALG